MPTSQVLAVPARILPDLPNPYYPRTSGGPPPSASAHLKDSLLPGPTAEFGGVLPWQDRRTCLRPKGNRFTLCPVRPLETTSRSCLGTSTNIPWAVFCSRSLHEIETSCVCRTGASAFVPGALFTTCLFQQVKVSSVAAALQVVTLHEQSCARSHCNIYSGPAAAARVNVRACQGHPFDRAHFTTSKLPLLVASRHTLALQ